MCVTIVLSSYHASAALTWCVLSLTVKRDHIRLLVSDLRRELRQNLPFLHPNHLRGPRSRHCLQGVGKDPGQLGLLRRAP